MNKLVSKDRTLEIIKTIFNDDIESCKLSVTTFNISFDYPQIAITKQFDYYECLFQLIAPKIGKLANDKKSIKFKVSTSGFINLYVKKFPLFDVISLYSSNDDFLGFVNIAKLEQFQRLREVLKQEYLEINKVVDKNEFEIQYLQEFIKIAKECITINGLNNRANLIINANNFNIGYYPNYKEDVSITILNVEYDKIYLEFLNNEFNTIKNVLESYDVLMSNSSSFKCETVINMKEFVTS